MELSGLGLLWLVTTVPHLTPFSPLLFANWKALPLTTVVVSSPDASVIELARSYGLNTHLEEMENSKFYHTYFKMMRHFPSQFVGFFNGDNLFDPDSVFQTLQILIKYAHTTFHNSSMLVVGHRSDIQSCTVDLSTIHGMPGLFITDWVKSHCTYKWFSDYAQDYFFFDKNFLDRLLGQPFPLSRVGGVAFDNWLTHRPLSMNDVYSIDASHTLTDFHLPRLANGNAYASHQSEASNHNRNVHRGDGPFADYKCGKLPLAMYVTQKDRMLARRQYVPSTDPYLEEWRSATMWCYKTTTPWWPVPLEN